jgi:hypothetical protein
MPTANATIAAIAVLFIFALPRQSSLAISVKNRPCRVVFGKFVFGRPDRRSVTYRRNTSKRLTRRARA